MMDDRLIIPRKNGKTRLIMASLRVECPEFFEDLKAWAEEAVKRQKDNGQGVDGMDEIDGEKIPLSPPFQKGEMSREEIAKVFEVPVEFIPLRTTYSYFEEEQERIFKQIVEALRKRVRGALRIK